MRLQWRRDDRMDRLKVRYAVVISGICIVFVHVQD